MNEYDLLRQQKKEETQNKIIEAAIKLFGKQGYDNTLIKQIADEAGVANSLVSKYYPTKENLLSQCYRYATDFSYPNNKDAAGKERLKILVEQTIEITKSKPEYYTFFRTLLFSYDLPQEYTEARREFFFKAPMYEYIVEEQKKGNLPQGNPHDSFMIFARMLYSVTDMYIHTLGIEKKYVAYKTTELVLNTLDEGFGKKEI